MAAAVELGPLFLASTPAAADEPARAVRSAEEFERTIAAARPGDTITIANGRYDGWRLEVPATTNGEEQRPIAIRGESPGGVTFTGATRVVIRGSYIEAADLKFEGTGAPTVSISGNHDRLTRADFLKAGTRHKVHRPIVVIDAGASDNEVDHCKFVGSASVSIEVRVPKEAPLPLRNHIHHNEFRDIPRYSENGQEPIQIGQGNGAHYELGTIIEYNSFVRANGDDELVSIKSSGNIIRYNVATDSDASISLRSGGHNLVEGNVLLRTKRGIIVTGNGNRIVNNFINQPRKEGILVAIGSKRYKAATSSVIAHNTVVRAAGPLRFELRDPEATDLPRGNTIVNNIFVAPHADTMIIAANGPKTLDEYLAMNDLRRNLFWWVGGGAKPAAESYRDNLVADPQLDLSNPLLPLLKKNSPARSQALPGFGGDTSIGASSAGAASANAGADEAGGPAP